MDDKKQINARDWLPDSIFESDCAGKKSRRFSHREPLFDVVEWYANNEIDLVELQLSVPGCEWKEFQDSKLFHDIVRYSESLKEKYQQTPDSSNCSCAEQCKAESLQSSETGLAGMCCESFWVRVRKALAYIVFRKL